MKKVIFYAPDDKYIVDDRNNTAEHHKAIKKMSDSEFDKFCMLRQLGKDVEVWIND